VNGVPPCGLDALDLAGELNEERATWFELLTGIQILLDRPRRCCPLWVLHGRPCAYTCTCRDNVSSTLDHPVQALDASGNRCVLIAPYRLRPGVEVPALERWCARHDVTWEVVPVTYWGAATIAVVLRHVEADGRSWHLFLASDLPHRQVELDDRTRW